MTGPDSDLWSIAETGDVADQSWNWQSTAPCNEAERLMADAADDGSVLAAISAYTVENRVLNAAHENARGPYLTDPSNPEGSRRAFSDFTWSNLVLEAGTAVAFVEAVQTDVHQMLIRREVRRICDAFTVDGRRCWFLPSGSVLAGRQATPVEDPRRPLAVSVSYDDRPIADRPPFLFEGSGDAVRCGS